MKSKIEMAHDYAMLHMMMLSSTHIISKKPHHSAIKATGKNR